MLPGKDFNHAQQQHYRVHSGKYISLRKKRAGDASFALLAAFQLLARCFPDDAPLLSTHPAHVQSRHLLLKSLLLVRADGHEDDASLLIACGTCIALGVRKPTRLCLQYHCRASANSIIGPACRLSPFHVQVLPVVVPPSCAMLVVC